MEKNIISATLRSREAYNLVLDTGVEEALSEAGKQILALAREYYERDTSTLGCDKEILLSQVRRKFPRHTDTFEAVVKEAFDNDVSIQNLQY